MTISARLLNIIYTNDMAASVAFYERLGLFRKEDGEVNTWWNEFPLGDATLALHWNADNPLATASNPQLHLQMRTDEFDAIYASIADMHPGEIGRLEEMGRHFMLTDPAGVRVQINEEV